MSITLFVFGFFVILLTSNLSVLYLSSLPLIVKLLISVALLAAFIYVNIKPGRYSAKNRRLRVLFGGGDLLLLFLCTSLVTAAAFLYTAFAVSSSVGFLITYGVTAVLLEAAVFWNGMLRVYATSVQLGIKWRVLGAVFGMIPVLNLIFLVKIITVTREEALFETAKEKLNDARKSEKICETKYPVLLVHGVFFRDSKLLNYWGRIPKELADNGARVYYTYQQSALSVEESAAEIKKRIDELCAETGAQKVNIIAHSKGGLDARYAISRLGANEKTASLTTINTPHRGCVFVDRLFDTVSKETRDRIAAVYNAALKKLGDTSPDFISAVTSLKSSVCEVFDKDINDMPNLLYQSVGSKAKNAHGGKFPLNISYPLVKRFDGENDGLVAVTSMAHGDFTLVTVSGKRGVTHADMIDLNRENIKGFDVREFYVSLVSDLKRRGL